jgi:Flp pilus assembly protein TadB
MEAFEMSEKPKTGGSLNLHATILTVVGIILVIAGVAVVTIHSCLRGSGLGTALLVLGFVMLIIAVWRYMAKRA